MGADRFLQTTYGVTSTARIEHGAEQCVLDLQTVVFIEPHFRPDVVACDGRGVGEALENRTLLAQASLGGRQRKGRRHFGRSSR